MYLYSLYGYEGRYILINNKRYSKEEFERMCKEAPLGGIQFGNPYYSGRLIKNHLINNYDFKDVDFVANFFIDANVD